MVLLFGEASAHDSYIQEITMMALLLKWNCSMLTLNRHIM